MKSPIRCLFVGVVAACLTLTAVRAQPLPTDPRLVTGTLDNGMSYIIRRHDNPPGRAAVWLHISTGSLNETDKQRGIAHYTEHMAFNGSANFPPGSVINFFQSLGLTFGQHQNAFTSFDQTVYQLALPDNKSETVQKGMLFLSDVALRLSMVPKEIDNERQVILEERRTRLSGEQRVQDYFFEQLAPGSIFGQRIPIGIESTIQGVKQQDFLDYYKQWYVPSNMTVMVVADMDTAAVADLIKKNFSGGKKSAKPTDQDPQIKPYTKTRAIIASDKELTAADVGLLWLRPAEPPATTVQLVRRDLVDTIGSWCFNRRLSKKVAEGKVSFLRGSASSSDLFGAATLSDVTASGDPSKWKAILSEMVTELQRARAFGFTETELADARKEIMAGAERAVETEATEPAGAILNGWNSAINTGVPITSAKQDLDIQKPLLPTITVAEVNARFNENFDTAKPVAFTLQLPSSADVPSEAQLIELGTAALAAKPAQETEAERPTALMTKLPDAGTIAEQSVHEASKVTSAWLANNVRVHYRFMDYNKDQVMVSIIVAGGEIEETIANRGISQAAGLALGRPATSNLTSTNVRDLMTGKKVRVGGTATADAFVIAVTGSPEELEPGMQLAHLLLTDPKVETASLDRWKEQVRLQTEDRKKNAEGVISDLVDDTLFPKDEIRHRAISPEQANAITADSATAWLKDHLAKGPLEVTVIGDIDQAKAMELVTRYLGSLPKRDKMTTATLGTLRTISRPKGPLAGSTAMDTQTDKSVAFTGFFGVDASNLRDVRLMNIASRILSTRAIETIREKKQLAYAPQVASLPGTEFPGYGMVYLFTTTSPDKLSDLLKEVSTLYDAFSKDGPTADEMETVRKQIANTLDEDMRKPQFWSQRLSMMDYRGTKIDDVLSAPDAYKAFTAGDVRDAFNRYYKPETRFELSVTPKPGAKSESK